MADAKTVALELYVLLAIINAFLGIGQEIYQSEYPTESIRSPFSGFPLGSDVNPEVSQLNTTGLTSELTNPVNSTGWEIPWVTDAISDFTAIIDIILTFVQFFTAGFIIDLLESIGFPEGFLYIITVPFALYVAYMTFVMISNRLGN